MTTPRLRLGQLLVDAKILTPDQLERVLELQKTDGRRLGALLVESCFVTETQVTQILSQQLSVPWVSLHHIDFSRQLLNLVPKEVAEKYCLVPIYVRHVRKQGETLYVAMDDPTNEAALEECRRWSGLPARAMIAAPSDIRNAIRVYYGGRASSDAAPQPSPPPESAPQGAAPEEVDVAVSPEPPGAVERPKDPSEPAPALTAPTSRETEPEPTRAPQAPPFDDGPELEVREVELRRSPKGKSARMISLTFLDGTTIELPATRKSDDQGGATAPGAGDSPSTPVGERAADSGEDQLTARDLVAALRAVAYGADASEILGENMKWEKMLAALLSVLLRKHLVADWEFVEELKKI